MNRRNIVIAFMIALLSSVTLHAQDYSEQYEGSSIFKFGVRTGMNFSSFDRFDLGGTPDKTMARIGFAGGLVLSVDLPVQGLTIQPEICYVSRGTALKTDGDYRFAMGYLDIPVNIQYGIDLIFLRPFLMVSPFVSYGLHKSDNSPSWSALNRFNYGVGVGLGLDLWKFQLQLKYNYSIPTLTKEAIMENTPEDITYAGHSQEMEISLVFFF